MTTIFAQQKPSLDTLHLKARPYVSFDGRDSLSKKSYANFYRQMRQRYAEKPVHNRIFNLLFDAPSQQETQINVGLPHLKAATAFAGQPVGKVTLKRLKPFGYNISDTTRQPTRWYQRTGNNLHILTHSSVIRKNLLFEKGEQLSVDKLADTERLLRQQPYIRDARIYLQPRLDSDSVDLLVLTEDVFPYAFGGSWGGLNRFSGFAENYNIFGIGHELSLGFLYDQAQTPQFGYMAGYGIPNIKGTFVDGQMRYRSSERERSLLLSLQRPFYAPDALWAGGLQYFTADYAEATFRSLVPARDTLLDYRYNQLDSWLARAIPLPMSARNSLRRSIVLAARYAQTNYSNTSYQLSDFGTYFHDRRLWVGSIGLSARSYRRDRYVFGFGRTEDVPEGYLLNFLSGIELNKQTRRPYLGINLARGGYIPRFGYLRGELLASTYINGYLDQRQVGIYGLYFSPLIRWNSYRIRQFVRLGVLSGDRRQPYEFLLVSNNQIRGLYTDELRGTRRLNLSLETHVFTPIYVLGFQFAPFAFADLAHLSTTHESFSQGEFVQGYGFGVNVRNDNLVFQTFQLRFSFYPSLPTDNSAFGISLKAIPRLRLSDFRVEEPNLLPFQ